MRNEPHEPPNITLNSVGATAHRLLRRKQLEEAIGLSRSNIYSRMDKNSPHYDATFPIPVKIGGRAVAWVLAEVESWIDSRIAARG